MWNKLKDFMRYVFDAIILNIGLFIAGIVLLIYVTYGGDSTTAQVATLFWIGVAINISSNAAWRYFQKVFGFDSNQKLDDFVNATSEQHKQIQDDLTSIKNRLDSTISHTQFSELMQAIDSIQQRLDEQHETGIDVETEDDEPVPLEIVDELSSTELLEIAE